MSHIRLMPFNKARGAFAKRFCVGGHLFVADRWYEVDDATADALGELTQGTGCPYFQVIHNEAEWQDIMRRELAAAVAGPGGAALAELFAHDMPKATTPKSPGEVRKSKFEGIAPKEIHPEDARLEVAAAALRAPVASVAADDLDGLDAPSELVPESEPPAKKSPPSRKAPAKRPRRKK